MMGKVVVFGPFGSDEDPDYALNNSRWIAAKHMDRLGENGVALVDGEARRAELTAALDDASIEGVVLCGHGDGGKDVFVRNSQHKPHDDEWRRLYNETSHQGAIYGSDKEAALDSDNVALMAGRWAHVLSCEIGMSPLPHLAVSLGVVAFAAYEQSIVQQFTVSTLPTSALTILEHLVTMTTMRMAERQFDEKLLVAEVRRANQELLDWFDSAEGVAWAEGPGSSELVGLMKFAMQLSSSLRVLAHG